MPRIEDSPGLFGSGFGNGTSYEIRCDFCGAVHNEGLDPEHTCEGEDVRYQDFAGKTVCECCFEAIEKEIICRQSDILEWLLRRNKRLAAHVVQTNFQLSALKK